MTRPPLHVLVGSRNPVKLQAVLTAMAPLFPEHVLQCEGTDAPSGVPKQPMSAAETRQGALNRVHYCRQQGGADFYVAMEAGVDVEPDGPVNFAYVVVADAQRQSVARSASLALPDSVYQRLSAGEELGTVMDAQFGTRNIKQQGGAVGLLTNGHSNREAVYRHALQLAMAPFLHPALYRG